MFRWNFFFLANACSKSRSLCLTLLTKWMIIFCRRSEELDGMEGLPIAISILTTPHFSNFEVLCIGSWMSYILNLLYPGLHWFIQFWATYLNRFFSDGVDEYVVNKFLCQIFTSNENFQGKTCSLVKETASRKFDMKEEVCPCCYSVQYPEFSCQLKTEDVLYLEFKTSCTEMLGFCICFCRWCSQF